MSKKYNVGIVGATGMVGQRFATLLENHPWFNVVCLAASSRSAGKTYEEAVGKKWCMDKPIPENMKNIVVMDATNDIDKITSQVDFVFCAVDMKKDEIQAREDEYGKHECPVVSNNSAHRFTPDVPMLVSGLNAEHINIIPSQRKRLGTKRGFIAVKSNCSLQSYVPALFPLKDKFPIKKVLVCTYQAISGAGKTFKDWPEMVENIIPFIGGEEEKSDGTEHFVMNGGTGDGAIVGEPSNYGYALGHRGLEWLEIRIHGKTAHGGIPELGINAISKAAKVINAIEEQIVPKLAERQNEYMGPSVMNFGTIEGGTQPSTVADFCSIKMDRRYVPGETVESVIKEYEDVLNGIAADDPDFRAEIIRMENGLMNHYDHAPLIAQPESDIAICSGNILAEKLGHAPEIARRRGWTDAGVLSTYGKIPTVVLGPGDLSFSHAVDERIPVCDLVEFVDIYANIAAEFCR